MLEKTFKFKLITSAFLLSKVVTKTMKNITTY